MRPTRSTGRCGNYSACGGKIVNTKFLAQISGELDFVIFKRRARGVGNADYRVVDANDPRRVD